MTLERPDIRSAIKDDESARLAELAAGRRVLEVGSQYGFSTVLMARVAKVVHAVDWHRGDAIVGRNESLPLLWENVTRYKLRDRVVIHVGRSETVLPLLLPGSFDFAFHDSYHSAEAVAADVALMVPLLVPGSLLALHDYGRYGVAEAVDGLGFERVSLTRTLVVVRIPESKAEAA